MSTSIAEQFGRSSPSRPETRTPIPLAFDGVADVVRYGMRALLRPHADRVRVLPGKPVSGSAIWLVDPYDAHQDLHRSRLHGALRHSGPLVLLSAQPVRDRRELACALALLQGRLFGWLCVGMSADDLIAALEMIHQGTRVIVPTRSALAQDAERDALDLTRRELEILTLVTAGLSNQQLAERLSLNISSVKSYIRTAYRKIGVTTRSRALL